MANHSSTITAAVVLFALGLFAAGLYAKREAAERTARVYTLVERREAPAQLVNTGRVTFLGAPEQVYTEASEVTLVFERQGRPAVEVLVPKSRATNLRRGAVLSRAEIELLSQ
jgi:hypothetical protein